METALERTDIPAWESKPSLRDIHGDPLPEGKTVIITEGDTEIAMGLLTKANEMVIQYIREAPLRSLNYEEGANGLIYADHGKKLGAPIGVCLAFKHGDDVFIGWSRRNSDTTLDKETFIARWQKVISDSEEAAQTSLLDEAHETVDFLLDKMAVELAESVALEPLPFSKKDARRVAVLRALTDDIVIKGTTKNRYFTRDGNILPDDLQKTMRQLIGRAKAYFKTDHIRNVGPMLV